MFSKTAESRGAGIYLENSRATLTDNRIYSNTTGANGRGGGVAIIDSPATLSNNTITGNDAHVGGGVELASYAPDSGALLQGNTINENTAFDYVVGSTTFDGAGGGVSIGGRIADTVMSNAISQNTAKSGGGLNIDNAPAIITGNDIQQNQAGMHGGGLYVQGSQPTIQDNRVVMNTATGTGGGLYLWMAGATVRDNLLQGNTGSHGTGLYSAYSQSTATFDGNRFLSNTATERGGQDCTRRRASTDSRNSVP